MRVREKKERRIFNAIMTIRNLPFRIELFFSYSIRSISLLYTVNRIFLLALSNGISRNKRQKIRMKQ